MIDRRVFGLGVLSVGALGACAADEASQPIAAANAPRALRDADIATRLTGHWIVVIDETARTRQMEILAVQAQGEGRFSAVARYGFTGERLQNMTLRGRDEGGALAVDFTAPNKNEVSARLGADGRFAGEIRYKVGASAGTTRRLVIRETAAEQLLADKVVVARGTKLTLVYVGADNCGPCASWERDVGPGTRGHFVASAAGRAVIFREVHARSYLNTAEPSRWPEDLTWLTKATNVASGTPRYIVLVDRKIVLNTQGRFSTRAEPLVRELVARRANAPA